MNLLTLQSPWLAAGVGLIAATLLVALHRLRTQLARRTVATTSFWSAARPPERASVLWGRFARWRSFLLSLLAIAALAAGLSGWQWPRRAEPVVFVIDEGFTMAARDADGRSRLDLAVAAARDDLARSTGPAAVIVAGEAPRVVASFDAPRVLATRSIDAISPTTRPASLDDATRLAGAMLDDERGRIRVYTDRPLDEGALQESIRGRIDLMAVGTPADNDAILSATFTGDASSNTGALHVRVGLFRVDGASTDRPTVRLTFADGATRDSAIDPSTGAAMFDQLSTDGQAVELSLVGARGSVPADDALTVRLPRRTAIAFRVADDVPPELRAALAAIGSDEPREGSTLIDVGTAGAAEPVGPAIRIVRATSDADRLAAGTPVTTADCTPLEAARCGDGARLPSDPAACPLLMAGDARLADLRLDAGRPTLRLSNALFNDGSTVAARPAFFLLLRRSVESLAGWTDSPSTVTVDQVAADPTWARTVTNRTDAIGSARASDVTRPASSSNVARAGGSEAALGSLEPWQWLLLLGLCLLLTDALLYALRRVA